MMTPQQRVANLKAARELIAEALADCGIPMIEGALTEADLNLHWALWNLGEPVDLHPALERA